MKSWFEIRGYPSKLIEQETEKIKFLKIVLQLGNETLEKVSFLFLCTTLYLD